MPRVSSPYVELLDELRALLEDERDFIANAANCASLLYHGLPNVNWAGFYLMKRKQLVLGPFQGKPACIRIDLGKGVCGTAAMNQETMVVPDVRGFAGHIACDDSSRSEIVVPLLAEKSLIGVLDLDSPLLNRFDQSDARGLAEVARVLLESSSIPEPE
jgi:L-methionine (R)-S-oxide reductase